MKTKYKKILLILLFVLPAMSCEITNLSAELEPDDSYPEIQPMPSHVSLDIVEPPTPTAAPLRPTREISENGVILFQDDFSDPETGWDVESYESGFSNYVDNGYMISLNLDGHYIWGTAYQNFGDVVIEVAATKLSGGDDNFFGIVCKHQDTDNFYALVISSDGYSLIRKRTSDGMESFSEWIPSAFINQGSGATNLMRGECVGNRITLYVNGHFLIEAFDDSITSGDVGVIGGTITIDETEVLFDNFVVMEP